VAQSPTQYTPQEIRYILQTLVHRNVCLSDVTVSDVLESNHLPVFLHILDNFITTDSSASVETRTDTKRFRFLASALNPVLIKTDNVEEDENAAVTFSLSSSAYNLSTRKLTLLDLNNELPSLDHLLRLKQKLWNLLH
jgi:hypothetical protein